MISHLIIMHLLTKECPRAQVPRDPSGPKPFSVASSPQTFKIMVRNVVDKTPKDKRKSSGPRKRSTPSSEVIYSSPKRPGSAAGGESVERSELAQARLFRVFLL